MKAKDFILWLSRENVSGEEFLVIEVPERKSEKWQEHDNWWKSQDVDVDAECVPAGTYVWMPVIEPDKFDYIVYDYDYKPIDPDIVLSYKHDDTKINMYRIQ
jgi:hypothetical protein